MLSPTRSLSVGYRALESCLQTFLVEQFQEQHGMRIHDDNIVMQRLRDAAERAMLEIAFAPSTEIHLPFLVSDAAGPRHLQTGLSIEVFKGISREWYQPVEEALATLFETTNVSRSDLDEVVLMGRAREVPLLEERLLRPHLTTRLYKGAAPQEIAAIGAAFAGRVWTGA